MRNAPLWLALACLTLSPACKSDEEKAAEEMRQKAGEELRRKANLSVDEHEVNCDKGDAMGCAALATAYQIGEDKPSDPAKAQELFEKACGLGHAQSCLDAADKYLDAKQWEKAEPLLDSGCKAEDDGACTRLMTVRQEIDKAKAAAGGGGEAEAGGAAKAEGGEAEMTDAERLMKEIEEADQDED